MPEHQTWFRFLPGHESLRLFLEGQLGTTLSNQTLEIQHVLGTVFALILVFLLALVAYRRIADAKQAVIPEEKLSIRTFFELITEMVLREMEALMGPKEARVFLPLIGTCAVFILVSNSMGLLPGFSPPTSNLNTTLACALVVVVSSEIYGFKRHGLGYLKEFCGGLGGVFWFTPLPYFIFLVEAIGHLVRLVSLSVRLMGNMYADHTMVGIFLVLVPFFCLTALPIQLLGVLVIVVQTIVFSLLSMVYVSLAVAGEGEHAEEH